jgi:hypothetical protein
VTHSDVRHGGLDAVLFDFDPTLTDSSAGRQDLVDSARERCEVEEPGCQVEREGRRSDAGVSGGLLEVPALRRARQRAEEIAIAHNTIFAAPTNSKMGAHRAPLARRAKHYGRITY